MRRIWRRRWICEEEHKANQSNHVQQNGRYGCGAFLLSFLSFEAFSFSAPILTDPCAYAVAPPFTTAMPFMFAVLTHTMHRFQRNERGDR